MKKLLAVGPLPPPLTGTPISFKIFCDETQKTMSDDSLLIVDSSPKHLKQVSGTGISFSSANIVQSLKIISQFCANLFKVDVVIIFASSGYVISLGPILLLLSKIFSKPCYFRLFGGSLDVYYESLPRSLQWLAITTLRQFNGVIVQTDLLKNYFIPKLGQDRVHRIPGYRVPPPDNPASLSKNSTDYPKKLKAVFVGIVKVDKGVFVLLESLRQVSQIYEKQIECDFYGNIHEPVESRFLEEITTLNNAQYKGVLDWREMIPTLTSYDLLILPSFYHAEGHPGVLIEAMMAGIPVIASDFRSIPELIKDGENGLLVQPNDPHSLANALERLIEDKKLLQQLAVNNSKQWYQYQAKEIVPQLLELIGYN